MTLANEPDPLDRLTTAQGLFLSADAYLDAARRLQAPLSQEGRGYAGSLPALSCG